MRSKRVDTAGRLHVPVAELVSPAVHRRLGWRPRRPWWQTLIITLAFWWMVFRKRLMTTPERR